MESKYWHERWERNEIGFHQDEINLHLRDYWSEVGLEPGRPVFVPLCGKSNDLLWLDRQGHPVIGVEISPVAVEAFFRDNGLSVHKTEQAHHVRWQHEAISILCGDYFQLQPQDLKEVGAVFDRASLVALPPELRRRYVQHLAGLLQGRVPILLVTLEYAGGEMQGPPFSVHEEEVHTLYGDLYAVKKLATRDVLRDNPHLRGKGLTYLTEKVFLLGPPTHGG